MVYGKDVAILASDALLSTSFQRIPRHTKGMVAERVLDISIRLGKSVGTVGLTDGQVVDLEYNTKTGVTLEELT